MARFLLLVVVCFILLDNVFLVVAMTNKSEVQTTVDPDVSSSSVPTTTLHRKHHSKSLRPSAAPALSPTTGTIPKLPKVMTTKPSIVSPQLGDHDQQPSSSLEPVVAVVVPSASQEANSVIAEAPHVTKEHKTESKDEHNVRESSSVIAEAPHITKEHKTEYKDEHNVRESSGENNHGTPKTAEAPLTNRRLGKHHRHYSTDKSVAGGGVILGGLATTFLVSVFCYIRATRRRRNINNGSEETNE